MADKLMYMPNDVTQNYLFCKFQLVIETFDTQHFELTNQNSKVLKVGKPTYMKCYHKTLEPNKKPIVPSILVNK